MKGLLLIVPFILHLSLSAQEIKADCHLLNRCISTPIFAKNFLYQKVTADTIILMDTSNVIPHCQPDSFKGKVFKVQSELIPKRQLVKNNSVLLFLVAKRECVLVYSFFSPSTGGALSFNYLKNSEGDYDVIGYKMGFF